MISAARMFLCNDDLGQIIEEERGEDLVPCLRCDICHGLSFTGDWLSACTLNPVLGRKHRISRMIQEPGAPKRVAVVGGGPAGMKAALTLKKRGHAVVLFEKSDALGGQIKTSRYGDFKWRLRRYLDFMIAQLDKNEIEYHLNTKATPDLIRAGDFDITIFATGALPAIPAIEGVENAKHDVLNVYEHEPTMGKRVVVIGGSSGPAEAAIYLSQMGHEVTELSRKNIVGYDLNPVHARGAFNELSRKNGIRLVPNAKTFKIEPGRVRYYDLDGNEQYVECDDILAAGGTKPVNQDLQEFYGITKDFYMIGDVRQVGTLRTAIRDAYSVAMRI